MKTHKRLRRKSEEKEGVAADQWKWLPDLALDLILEKLELLADYAHVAAVCKRWYEIAAAAWEGEKKRRSSHWRHPPFLLVGLAGEKGTCRIHYNFKGGDGVNLKASNWYNLPFPQNFKRIIGSSYGWIMLIEHQVYEITLFNPFCGSRIILPLLNAPALDTDHHPVLYEPMKVVLSGRPTDKQGCIVVALSMARVNYLPLKQDEDGGNGSISWEHFDLPDDESYDDLSFAGGGQICFVHHSNQISFLDFGESPPRFKSILFPKRLTYFRVYASSQIVESSKGEVLLVVRRKYFGKIAGVNGLYTNRFSIFELRKTVGDGSNQEEAEWSMIKKFGGSEHALFLADSAYTSFNVCVSDLPFYDLPNCIYFINETQGVEGVVDIGVYNIEKKNLKKLEIISRTNPLEMPATWVMPMLKLSASPNIE